MKTENQKVSILFPHQIEIVIKREDLIHPLVSGNKYRKLKYNLKYAQENDFDTVVTFGGAYSNHIVAVAAAAKEKGFKAIGIIRGDELQDKIADNSTLSVAQKLGMHLKFVSREDYKQKASTDFLQNLKTKFGSFYLIPEGGTNELAIKGCEEILQPEDSIYDFVCCAVGTGGTISGLIRSAQPHQKVLGFSSLKTDYLNDEIHKFATANNWELITAYHFGGYGKVTDELIRFMNQFYQQTQIPLDPVYTSKMIFGINDKIKNGFFPKGSKILAIHTGGLQGIKGMNTLLKKKNKETIHYYD